eukprot:4067800-Pyramimonas_sp.AAC.1
MAFKDVLPRWFQGGKDKKDYAIQFAEIARETWGTIEGNAALGNARATVHTQACCAAEALQIIGGGSFLKNDFEPDAWETIAEIDDASARNEPDLGAYQIIGQASATNEWWRNQKKMWIKRTPKNNQYGKDMKK